MYLFTICSVLLAVAIGSSSAIFEGLFQSSGCTVLANVPLTQFNPYFKVEIFPSLKIKLDENQSRFNRDLRQVWVDTPDPLIGRFCGGAAFDGALCVLNAHFPREHEWKVFRSGDAKQEANKQLWIESQGYDFYRVWADAPDRYCKRGSNSFASSIVDFFG